MTPANFFLLVVSLLGTAAALVFFLQRRSHRRIVRGLRDQEERAGQRIRDLSATQERLEAVFQGMQEAILLVRQDGEILLVNPAFERAFGAALEAVKGKNILEVLRHKDLYQVMRSCWESRKDQTGLLEMTDAEPRCFEVRAVYLNPLSKDPHVLAVLHDVTALKKAEIARRDFVANVSHELRTPLGAITGSVETLLDGAMHDGKACTEFLAIARDNASRLKDLIDDLLDLAKIESQEMSLRLSPVDLRTIVEECAAGIQSRVAAKAIRWTLDMPPGLTVLADAPRIKQVLNNLFDNAIKFNRERGEICVRGKQSPQGVEVCVQDTGPGIPPDALPRVFERFYRVEKDRPRSAESGTGLGLSIAKHIVEKHGGRIWAQSEWGHGSTFGFVLPS